MSDETPPPVEKPDGDGESASAEAEAVARCLLAQARRKWRKLPETRRGNQRFWATMEVRSLCSEITELLPAIPEPKRSRLRQAVEALAQPPEGLEKRR